MRKIVLALVAGLLMASVMLTSGFAAADGTVSGTFPDRVIEVIRSPPGGPRSDTFGIPIAPLATGEWYVTADSIAGSAVIVQVWQDDAGVQTLLSSSKLNFDGESSTRTALFAISTYTATFIPFGKRGTSVLREHFLVPSPPTASFTFSPAAPTTADVITFDASGSTDPDGDITGYAWDFGDTSTASGAIVTHQYAAGGDFTVTLTVTDSKGLFDTDSQVVRVSRGTPPLASFTTARELMSVRVDGSASSDVGGSIVQYFWTWGDGMSESSGMNPLAQHTYATPGKYTIALRVTDNSGDLGDTTREVTVNTATVDAVYSDFFAVPWGEWWDARQFFSLNEERPIGAECFSATGIAELWCVPNTSDTVPDVDTFPYTTWIRNPIGDRAIYAPYRFDINVRDHMAYTIEEPVLLPECADLAAALGALEPPIVYTCPAPAAGGSASINAYVQYITSARARFLGDPVPAGRGCPDVEFLNDGYLTELQLTVTMDAAAASKLLGVTSGTAWTPGSSETALISAGCGTGLRLDAKSGLLEKALKAWFEAQANGPYDILSAFGIKASEFGVEATGSFNLATGQHTLTVTLIGWGHETLYARWFYWGATSYADGVNLGAAPAGWWGMEASWFEDLRIVGTIADNFDARITGVQQYHFQHLADAGLDTIWFTADDVPKWVWQPVLADRLPSTPLHPASELKDYAGLTYVHATPGSRRYGTAFAYDYTPAAWALKAGETQTFRFPTATVVLYDPYLSPLADTPLTLQPIEAMIALAYTMPATDVGSYDAPSRILAVLGPTNLGTYPTTSTGKPLESRPMYNLSAG